MEAMDPGVRDQILTCLMLGESILMRETRTKLAPPRPKPEQGKCTRRVTPSATRTCNLVFRRILIISPIVSRSYKLDAFALPEAPTTLPGILARIREDPSYPGLLRFTFGLRTDLICEAKDSRPEAQKNVQLERESQ